MFHDRHVMYCALCNVGSRQEIVKPLYYPPRRVFVHSSGIIDCKRLQSMVA